MNGENKGESGIAVFHFRQGGLSHAVGKKALSGTAEVLYPVSLSTFQWVYVSNVGTRREKTRFALECSFRQMFEEGISEAPLQFLKSYV